MTRLAHVIDTFGADFRAQYQDRLTADHLRALAAMKHCRREASPKMQMQCSGCAHQILVPHSCGHRHCPHCQHHESQQWLERQTRRLVPADYFLITFTLPAEKTESEAGDLPDSSYPIGLTVAATAGSTVSYMLPPFAPQYGTATYATSSFFSAINSTTRVYTFTAPAGVTAGTVYDDFITASRVGTNPRSATIWVRIVVQ